MIAALRARGPFVFGLFIGWTVGALAGTVLGATVATLVTLAACGRI